MKKTFKWHIKPVIKQKKGEKKLEHPVFSNIGAVINKKLEEHKWKKVSVSMF